MAMAFNRQNRPVGTANPSPVVSNVITDGVGDGYKELDGAIPSITTNSPTNRANMLSTVVSSTVT